MDDSYLLVYDDDRLLIIHYIGFCDRCMLFIDFWNLVV